MVVAYAPSGLRYDWILVDGKEMNRVQVKTLRKRGDSWELKLRATNPDYIYSEDDVDFVIGHDPDTLKTIWVHASNIEGRTQMTFPDKD